MTKVQGIWDEMAEDESRKVYDILGVYSLRIHTGIACINLDMDNHHSF